MEKRHVQQWRHTTALADGKERTWTEIRMPAEELLVMLGCASGSNLIGLHIDRDGLVTITADEHLEQTCLTGSYPPLPGLPPGSSVP